MELLPWLISSRLAPGYQSEEGVKGLWCWWRSSARDTCVGSWKAEGPGEVSSWKELSSREGNCCSAGSERKTLSKRQKKKKKFCSWFIFLLWAYPVSLFLEKSCSLRYNLSFLETLLPQETCNSGKNKSWDGVWKRNLRKVIEQLDSRLHAKKNSSGCKHSV